jgi:hypothetical protein
MDPVSLHAGRLARKGGVCLYTGFHKFYRIFHLTKIRFIFIYLLIKKDRPSFRGRPLVSVARSITSYCCYSARYSAAAYGLCGSPGNAGVHW